ncbi:MAG: hypothetical protein Q8928_17660 [Bacteroidota bacterium]|nr:hypothetical protein [Bacteroidota bacterium]
MQRIRSFVAILLIPAVCWLFTNAVINQHSHILPNGQIITHAHPYTPDKGSSSPFQSHQHSPLIFQILGQLSNPAGIFGIAAAILSVFLFRKQNLIAGLTAHPLFNQHCRLAAGRAPPAIV